MDLVPEQQLVEGNTQSPSSDTRVDYSASNTAYAIDKNKLIVEKGSGYNERSGKVENQSGIPIEVHEEMVQFLDNHLQTLLNLKKANPTAFNDFMSSPTHQAEAALLGLVMKGDSVDKEQLGNLLEEKGRRLDEKTGTGWQTAMTALESVINRNMFAVGLAEVLKENGVDTSDSRAQAVDMTDQSLNRGKGWLRSHPRFNQMINVAKSVSATLGGAGVGAGVFGGLSKLGFIPLSTPTGAAIGAGVGVAALGGTAAYLKIQEGLETGYYLNPQAFANGLRLIQDDPVEAALLQQTIGINPYDFRVNNNTVELSGTPTFSGNVNKLRIDTTHLATFRLHVYESWGINIDSLDAFPEQSFFANGDNVNAIISNVERNGAFHAQRVDDLFNRKVAAAGGPGAINSYELLKLKTEARTEIFGKLVQELIEEQTGESANDKRSKDIQSLKNAVSAFTANAENPDASGEKVKEVTSALRAKKETLSKVNNELSASTQTIDKFRNASRTKDAILSQIQSEYGKGLTDIQKIEQEIKKREGLNTEALRNLRTELVQAEEALEQAKADGEAVDRYFGYGKDNLTLLTKKSIPPDVNLELDQKSLATLSLDQIMEQINAKNKAGAKDGWPADQNADSAKREMVLQAMAEARAREAQPGITNIDEFITKSGLSGADIRGMTPKELADKGLTFTDDIKDLSGTVILKTGDVLDEDVAKKLITQATQAFSQRAQSFNTIKQLEVSWRADHNNGLTERRTQVAAEITKLHDELNTMDESIKTLHRINNIDTIANIITTNHLDEYTELVNQIGAFSSKTAREAYDLAFDKVSGLSYAEGMQFINDAAANSKGGWPPANNADEANVRTVVAYLAEARARKEPIVETLPDSLKFILDLKNTSNNPAITEAELLSYVDPKNFGALLSTLNKRLDKSNKLSGTSIDTLRRAVSEANNRSSIRAQKLQEVMMEAKLAAVSSGASPIEKTAANVDVQFLKLDTKLNNQFEAENNKLFAQMSRLQKLWGHPSLVTIADINDRILKRNDELRTLRDYSDISASLEDYTNKISTYSEALTKLRQKRTEIAGKLDRTDTQNITAALITDEIVNREQFTTEHLQDLKNQLVEAQADIEPEDQNAVEEVFERGKKVYENIITNIDPVLAPLGPNRLRDIDLPTLTVDQIQDRINQAHAANNTVGWPADQNGAHRLDVEYALAEAKTRESVATFKANADLDDIIGWGVTEKQMSHLSRDEVMQFMNRAYDRNPGAGIGWPDSENSNTAKIDKVNNAITEAKRRFNLRLNSNAYTEASENLTKQIQQIDTDIVKAAEGLGGDRIIIETTLNMTEHIGDRLFPWAAKWAGPNGLARKNGMFQPIPPTDKTYSEIETKTAAGAARNLPESYYELLNALTGYQSKSSTERAATFATLVDHPQFSPQALAEKLNDLFDLGLDAGGGAARVNLPLNIRSVFVVMHSRLNSIDVPLTAGSTQPSINSITVHEAMQSLVDNYIKQAKVL